jgi:type IV pilus assembly protein PilM
MSEVLKKIEDLRDKKIEDEKILDIVIGIVPEKKQVFQEAIKRGATAKQIIDKMISDNKKEQKQEKKEDEKKKAEAKKKEQEREKQEKEKKKQEEAERENEVKKLLEKAEEKFKQKDFQEVLAVVNEIKEKDPKKKSFFGFKSSPQRKKAEELVEKIKKQKEKEVEEKKKAEEKEKKEKQKKEKKQQGSEKIKQAEQEKKQQEQKEKQKVEQEKKEDEKKKAEAKKKEQEKIKRDKEEHKKKIAREEKRKDIAKKLKIGRASLKGNRFLKDFFAATRYLLLGVDISDHSIEVLLLDKDGAVASYGRSILEDGVVNNGDILNQKKLSEALKKTLEGTKPHPLNIPEHTTEKKKVRFAKKEHKAIVSLPESKIYTQVFKFKNKSDIYKRVKDELAKTLPFEKEEFYWDFTEVSTREGVKVVCVAVLQDVADSYIHFFKSTNIDPVAFEVEGESIGRALLPLKKIKRVTKKRKLFKKKEREKENDEVMADNKSRMIIDLGARSTMIDIFNEEAVLVVSVPLPYAGNYFTNKVAEKLNISKQEANKVKEEEGFNKNGKTYEILKPHGEKIIKEIEAANRYYEREFGSKVKEIVLAGGTALLPGITEFFQERVKNISVKVGDPLKKINDFGMLNQKEKILYSNVIGLGLRSLKKDPIETGINLLPEEVRNQARKSQQETHRSVLLVAIFIVIAGFLLLGLSIYYLVYLPVPAPMQPLKNRILLIIDDKKVETVDVAFIADDLEGVVIYSGPGEESDVVGSAFSGEFYQATGQRAGWVRVKISEDEEGWIYRENLKKITTMSLEDFEMMEIVEVEEEDSEVDTE